DGVVLEHGVGADVVVSGQHVARRGQQQSDSELGHGIGVAPGRSQDRDAGSGGAGHVDVVGVATARPDGDQRQLEHRAAHEVALHDDDVGALLVGSLGQAGPVVDAQRGLVDPRVEHDVGQLPQGVEALAPERRGDEGSVSGRHDRHNDGSMTPASQSDLAVGIDIGTTSVKAVAADPDGNVVARSRVPHRVVINNPDTFEHDAGQAWRRGPRKALAALKTDGVAAISVTGMVPSLCAVDRRGIPRTPGLIYGDVRGRTGSGADPSGSGETQAFLRWTAAQVPDAFGYWPAQAVANFALSGEPSLDTA